MRRDVGDIGAVKKQPAVGGVVDAADQVEECCLAGAVGPYEGQDPAFMQLETHIVDGLDATEMQ